MLFFVTIFTTKHFDNNNFCVKQEKVMRVWREEEEKMMPVEGETQLFEVNSDLGVISVTVF